MKKILQYNLLFLSLFLFNQSYSQNIAVDFDGTNDFILTTSDGVSGNGARTIEAWIKLNSPAGTGNQNTIVDFGTFSTGGRFTLNVLFSNTLRIEVGGSGLNGTTNLYDSAWHHVAATYDPSSSTKFKLYVDGVLDGSGNITTSVNTGTTNKIQIGKRIDGVNLFHGGIDEVRVFNYVRTAAQISSDKNAEFCTLSTGLIAYYQLNEGIANGTNASNTVAKDYSGNGKTGTLTNFSLSGTTSNYIPGTSITPGLDVNITNISACNSYTAPDGTIFTTNGVYKDTLINSISCDSIITENITINLIDTSINRNGKILTSNQGGGATYQWFDCDSNKIITGETTWRYISKYNGNFAVIVSNTGCTDTSNCHSVIVNYPYLTEKIFGKTSLSPNPSNGHFTLNFESKSIKTYALKIIDMSGRTIYNKEINTNVIKVNEKLNSGIYMIFVETNKGLFKERFIVN